MKSNPIMARKESAIVQVSEIPENVVCELSASLVPIINAYFQRPEVQEEFERWKVDYDQRKTQRKKYTA